MSSPRRDGKNAFPIWILCTAAGALVVYGLTAVGTVLFVRNRGHADIAHNPPAAPFDQPFKHRPDQRRPNDPVVPVPVEANRAECEIADPPALPFRVDPALAKAKGHVFLSDLTEFAWKPGPGGWSFAKNGNLGSTWVPNGRILFKGADVSKGLSMHPPHQGYTRICYALDRTAKSLHGAAIFSEDEPNSTPPPTRFLILGDGAVIWRSRSLRGFGAREDFNIDVSNVRILELRTFDLGSNFGAHAAWFDPYVVMK